MEILFDSVATWLMTTGMRKRCVTRSQENCSEPSTSASLVFLREPTGWYTNAMAANWLFSLIIL